ncbi:uncharacterized protein LOC120675172 isoform X1 [Panicum virgatum]|uniref:uncharacterized protein LOC120675172 isoform X1 n=1 Tax=Panicum virgatum TaxID=38727 RepID=UPI0019D5DCD9|nr:uncharacterized protein LOC120675172 isoform X1 [Panicum virgatum]XP_039812207.1 uncharacterized protein LOC120675172 isoform X1 [Panicum virgatum]XP_039812208.1 uncharacterized protein LOC120675172 isoform X1 [Panicum virgatum]XP_039812209.1 uncharacterized protein LOC120675172 isoform X1 [Panicum virgatum]XP_039812210.1 uncharacterized protein LOC120675172 isoform X1 [Panicum virgatum]
MPVAAGAVLQKLGSNAAYEVEKVGKPHSDGAQGAPSSRCSRRGFDRQASNPLLSRMKSGDSSLGRMEMLGCLARVSSDRPAPHLLEVLLFYVGNSIFVTGKWTSKAGVDGYLEEGAAPSRRRCRRLGIPRGRKGARCAGAAVGRGCGRIREGDSLAPPRCPHRPPLRRGGATGRGAEPSGRAAAGGEVVLHYRLIPCVSGWSWKGNQDRWSCHHVGMFLNHHALS